jgi:hypothetical protein
VVGQLRKLAQNWFANWKKVASIVDVYDVALISAWGPMGGELESPYRVTTKVSNFLFIYFTAFYVRAAGDGVE